MYNNNIKAPTPNDPDGVSGTAVSDYNPLSTQGDAIDTTIKSLKTSWTNIDTYNASSMAKQIKSALVTLFDNAGGPNSLANDSSVVYLDIDKIATAIKETGALGSLLFSKKQFSQILDSISDHGNDFTTGATGSRYYYFKQGDSINARINVIDTDMGYDSNNKPLNMDSWLVKICEIDSVHPF